MNHKSLVKNIFIVRHGHAEFNNDTDYKRVLKDKGILSAQKTAIYIKKKLLENHIKTPMCLSSAAVRTRQTAEIICQANAITHIDYHQSLYATTVSHWLDKIKHTPVDNLVIVGHNPTFSQMLQYWCGHNIYMKPANCAYISLEFQADGITYPARLHDFYQNE